MININKPKSNCVTSFASCVKWDRDPIPCLGIKNGDFLDDIMFIVADKLCELATPLDLSSISLQCLLDKGLISTEPLTKTIASLLQIAFANSCTLKDAITAIETKLNGTESSLVLDLKCIKSNFIGTFGETLPYNEQSVLQALINDFCILKTSYTSLFAKFQELENKVNNWVAPVTPEATIATCLFSSRPVSQGVILLASQFCSFRTSLGTDADIAKATSRTCDNLETLFQSTVGWIPNAGNFMQKIHNYELVICNLLERVTTIENTCCAITCDDVKTMFTAAIVDSSLIFYFRDIDGTKIPTGFTDCGSTYKITSKSNPTGISGSLTIAQGLVSPEIILTSFSKGESLLVKVLSKMCNGSLTCTKCEGVEVKYTSNCCVITNEGSTNNVLVYTVPTSSQI